MTKLSKQSVAVIIVLISLAVIWTLKSVLLGTFQVNPVEERSKGNLQAPIQVVEYIDFQCPACAYGAKLLKEFMQKNPDQVHLQLHHFPLAMHPHAITASIYAECAARQKKFWEYHDLLIDNQDQWKSMEDARPAFQTFAQEVALDQSALDRCIADPTIEEHILTGRAAGAEQGVKSTPTYFINGEMMVGATSLIKKLNQLSNTPES